MASMDIFNSSAFSLTSLTGAITKVGYKPQLLGSLGIFEPMPVRTRSLFVDRREDALTLIPTSETGEPPEQLVTDTRNAVSLNTTRLAKSFRLNAVELQGIRAFGRESELEQVQSEYLRRMGRIRGDLELTQEYHRLGALQGMLLDADGSSVIYNYYTTFGVTKPTAVDFDLDNPSPANGAVRKKCADLIRSMSRSAGGAFAGGVQIHALVGDAFYDALVTHPEVEKTYLNWAAAADLRKVDTFGAFTYGGITWHNYRGTDDNSTVAVGADAAIFFPVGATDVFKVAYSPAEFGPYINTAGQEVYAMNIMDRDRQAWTQGEIYSYPLYFCQRPDVLRSGTRT